MTGPLFAHSLKDRPIEQWEPLSDHLADVAELAAQSAAKFDVEAMGWVAGALHDIGKVSRTFQDYIGSPDIKKGPDHSTAGAREAIAAFGPVAGRLIAFAIAGHHSGLMDGKPIDGVKLDDRLYRALPDYARWREVVGELPATLAIPARFRESPFATAFLGRMLFSCLVDADCRATGQFYAKHDGRAPDRLYSSLEVLRGRLDGALDRLQRAARESDLNRLRAEILAHARGMATQPPGLFTMSVPTGGGKTLASLAFALDHAIAHGLDRVVYVIPYTSIVEQTADVFRDALGTNGLSEDVREHHGNVEWTQDKAAEGKDGFGKLRRPAETWDAPIVVTTAVQFFESLYTDKTQRSRKLHNLAKSVIVLDEAQTLPVDLLKPCLAAIDQLASNYGASLVLCTATQPAVFAPKLSGGLKVGAGRELAPMPERLHTELKRVTFEDIGPVSDAEIVAQFAVQPRMLCIVNSRKHAQALYKAMAGAELAGARHLTTLMCPAHRRHVLARARADLKDPAAPPVRIVATSLVEAGVDIDLPEVWRAETGLDSIAQAAGRCNREGRMERGRVVVFESTDTKSPAMFQQQIDAKRETIRHHAADPLGPAGIERYFSTLYWKKGDAALDRGGDGKSILGTLTEGTSQLRPEPNFAYETVARNFRMIDTIMEPVFVPYDPDGTGEAMRLVDSLRAILTNGGRPGGILRRLQSYTVGIPTRIRDAMLATHALEMVHKDHPFAVVNGARYTAETGLSLDAYELGLEDGGI